MVRFLDLNPQFNFHSGANAEGLCIYVGFLFGVCKGGPVGPLSGSPINEGDLARRQAMLLGGGGGGVD